MIYNVEVSCTDSLWLNVPSIIREKIEWGFALSRYLATRVAHLQLVIQLW